MITIHGRVERANILLLAAVLQYSYQEEMSRKLSHSPLKEWQQSQSLERIGLLTLYRMQTEASPHRPTQWKAQLPQIHQIDTNTISHCSKPPKQQTAQPDSKIFSHRGLVTKRKQYQPKHKNQQTSAKSSWKKTLLMKEYNFGEINEQELKQHWIRDKIYREFIVYEGNDARQEQNGTKDVFGKTGSRRQGNTSKQKLRTTRINTEPHQALKKAASLKREEEQPHQLQRETIDQLESQRAKEFLNTPLPSKPKKTVYFKHSHYPTKDLRNHFLKNRSQRPQQREAEMYQSNLLSTSLQNMPISVINQQSPRGDRLKDMIRKYLKSNERRSFTKKMTILQSI